MTSGLPRYAVMPRSRFSRKALQIGNDDRRAVVEAVLIFGFGLFDEVPI